MWKVVSHFCNIQVFFADQCSQMINNCQWPTVICSAGWSSIPEVPKKQVCNVFTISLKKLEMKLTFLMQINFWTVDFNTLDIKVFYNAKGMIMKMWRTWWWEWSSILKVLKITSLQCLYNTSKNKLWMELSIFDLSYRFLMKVARHV